MTEASSNTPASGLVRFTWFTLAWNILVILWGTYVRASGSGAGCGGHWPLCNGEVVPLRGQTAMWIEYTHRLSSAIALLLIVLLVVFVFRARPKRHPARLGSVLSLIFVLTEALIGAGLVLFKLVAQNDSLARALFVGVHLVNTFFLLASLTLTAFWLLDGRRLRLKPRDLADASIYIGAFGLLLVGMSGTIAALGDTLFPPESLAQGLAQDLSKSTHWIIRLRVYHPILAVATALLLLALPKIALRYSHRARNDRVRRAAPTLSLLIFAQLAVGVLNIAMLAPVGLQLTHLLLADLIWIVLTWYAAATFVEPWEGGASHETVGGYAHGSLRAESSK